MCFSRLVKILKSPYDTNRVSLPFTMFIKLIFDSCATADQSVTIPEPIHTVAFDQASMEPLKDIVEFPQEEQTQYP